MEEAGITIQLWQIIVGALVTLCSVGGVVYLIVEHLLNKDKTAEEVKQQQVENVKQAVEYGIPMVEIYKEIDKIIEAKNAPILAELKEIKENWCCYREACAHRVRNEADAKKMSSNDN